MFHYAVFKLSVILNFPLYQNSPQIRYSTMTYISQVIPAQDIDSVRMGDQL